jgi:hypothetical protein
VKALTIKQPWPDCIVCGWKRVENRTWKPPDDIIGTRIAIHAGKQFDHAGHRRLWKVSDVVGPHGVVSFMGWLCFTPTVHNRARFGAIVATAVVERVTTDGDSPWFTGPYGWVLRDVRSLKDPIPCRGAQGLWTVPEEVAARLMGADGGGAADGA